MKILVSEFKFLNALQPHIPVRHSPHPVQKTTVVTMQILFKDEKYESDTIDILSQQMKSQDNHR